ncbi:unnamed protein product [Schistosoma intercalatum]|nr:unnamed protein product [Schistosoma intercalatum]
MIILSVKWRYNLSLIVHLSDEINMELSTESQTIDQCMLKHELIKQIYLMIVDMKCRSKIYQSIEQKIVMGGTTVRNSDTMKKCLTEEQSVYTKLVDEYRNENCQLPTTNNIPDNQQLQHKFRRLDLLLRDRYGKIRVCNIYLFSHDILQTIHEQIDNQLKKQRLHVLIEQFRTNEKQLQDLKNEINMELSTEHQSINQCMLKHELIKQIYLMIVDMKCRSKIYQSIERKILMGGTTVRNSDTMKKCLTEEQSVYTKLVDEYRNENCQLPTTNNIPDNQQLQHKFRRLDLLLRDRYGKIRVCNIYLFSHDILQTIHEQIDNQLKKR